MIATPTIDGISERHVRQIATHILRAIAAEHEQHGYEYIPVASLHDYAAFDEEE